ncbi:MAG: topoisomerase C-terminal repeat-containing protein, partial [Methylocella sp.]
TEVLDSLNELLGPHIFPAKEDGSNPRACSSCGTGQLSLKLGKFGAFIGCSHYPDCKFTRTLADTSADAAANGERAGAGILGQDSASGEEITLRDGRFGAYVQQGEGEKPKRVSLPKNIDSRELTMDQALGLLSLPREIARHPETKDPILAGIGRFGPYVQHGKTYASLGKDDDILSIGENRAIDLIVAKESGLTGRRFGDAASAPARVLGEHPAGGEVVVKAGRYGPYVNHGKINATLPRDADATRLTLDDAIALIAAKAAGKGGNAGMQGRLLGAHPTGGPVTVRAGRFGPYVNRGNTNATLKGGMSPETITLEEAIRLIEDKQEAGTRSRAKKIMRAAPKTTAKAAAARKLATKPPPQKAKKVKRA